MIVAVSLSSGLCGVSLLGDEGMGISACWSPPLKSLKFDENPEAKPGVAKSDGPSDCREIIGDRAARRAVSGVGVGGACGTETDGMMPFGLSSTERKEKGNVR